MLNDIEFGTTSASSSNTTTPKRRTRRKVSSDSEISFSSTASTSKCKPITRAKQIVQLKKEQRLMKFLDESDEELITRVTDLRSFAQSEGGLVNDEIRARVWPILADSIDLISECSSSSEESSSSCSDSDFETAVSSLSSSDDNRSNNHVCIIYSVESAIKSKAV